MTSRLDELQAKLRRECVEAHIELRMSELRLLAARTEAAYWREREAERTPPLAWRPFPEARRDD